MLYCLLVPTSVGLLTLEFLFVWIWWLLWFPQIGRYAWLLDAWYYAVVFVVWIFSWDCRLGLLDLMLRDLWCRVYSGSLPVLFDLWGCLYWLLPLRVGCLGIV